MYVRSAGKSCVFEYALECHTLISIHQIYPRWAIMHGIAAFACLYWTSVLKNRVMIELKWVLFLHSRQHQNHITIGIIIRKKAFPNSIEKCCRAGAYTGTSMFLIMPRAKMKYGMQPWLKQWRQSLRALMVLTDWEYICTVSFDDYRSPLCSRPDNEIASPDGTTAYRGVNRCHYDEAFSCWLDMIGRHCLIFSLDISGTGYILP